MSSSVLDVVKAVQNAAAQVPGWFQKAKTFSDEYPRSTSFAAGVAAVLLLRLVF